MGIIITLKRWAKLFLWLPAHLSVMLAAPVRFITMLFYFPVVITFHVIASISDFLLGIWRFFSFFWANFFMYYLIVFMMTLVAVPFLIVLGTFWLMLTILQFFVWMFQYFNNLFFGTWWSVYNWTYTNMWWLIFGGPSYMVWFFNAIMTLLIKPMDDVCWVFWDIWDDWAVDMLTNTFTYPTW